MLKRPTVSSDLLAAALEACPVGLSIQNSEGQLIAANTAARTLLSSLAGSSPAEAAPLGREAGSFMRGHVQSFQHDGGNYTLTCLLDLQDQMDAQQELLRLAYIDAITGLPNRVLLEEHVAELIQRSEEVNFGVAFLDIDNFKDVNDYYGHAIGDLLLKKIADRVASSLRAGDMLARVGGDEFILLIAPASDEGSTRAFALEVAEKVKQPFFIDGYEIFASASIGISMYPQHGSSFDDLRQHADAAMYKVKQSAKGGVIVFDSDLSAEASSRMQMEQRLRLAIRDCRVCCAFQPQVNIETGEVIGVEVLLRWQDEDGEIHAPGDFVGLAVELGLINEIAFRVLTETVRSVPLINEIFGDNARISMNVAAKQASDLGFMTDFIDSISATGLADRFTLELTEDAFIAKGLFQEKIIPYMRTAGIRISIDDFGTGFSSLGAIADIPADELKIDRSFIRGIHNRSRNQVVLRAIEQIGHSLNMTVLAEGVETEEEAAYLEQQTNIRSAQGYLFGRPAVIQQTDTDYLLQAVKGAGADQRWTPLPRRHQIGRAVRAAGGR